MSNRMLFENTCEESVILFYWSDGVGREYVVDAKSFFDSNDCTTGEWIVYSCSRIKIGKFRNEPAVGNTYSWLETWDYEIIVHPELCMAQLIKNNTQE